MELKELEDALEEYGSQRAAAKALGISRMAYMNALAKARGLCVQCKKVAPKENCTRCESCLIKAKGNKTKEQKTEYNKKYYARNKEELREAHRTWVKDNRQRVRDYNNEYYKSPHQRKMSVLKAHKRRALEDRHLAMNVLDIDTLYKTFDYKCFRCEEKENLNIDHHIPLSLGGRLVADNCVVLCSSCNGSKGAKLPEDFYTPLQLIQLDALVKKKDLERACTDKQLFSEFDSFMLEDRGYRATPSNNRITTYFNPHFYEKENLLWQKLHIQEALIANRRKYLEKDPNSTELLRGFKISNIYKGFSHHSPFYIKQFIKEYDIKSLYDPCGGWGHRLLGAEAIKYIYNDIDDRSCIGAEDMISHFNIHNKVVYNKDCTQFTPEEDYEAVFTCPPYYNLESYTHENSLKYTNTSYSQWLNDFWRETIRKSVKPGVKYFAFIINTTNKDRMIKICEEEGLILSKEISLGKGFKSHLNKKVKSQEFLVILDKPQNS